VFNSLEHAVQKDYVVVLRPELPRSEVAAAIRRSLLFKGRPYDFDFDFASDDKLVCTELVYRAYDVGLGFGASREDPAMPGLIEVMGRVTMPANELARFALYMAENPEPRPHVGYPGRKLRIVALLDRREKHGPAELLLDQRARERLAESVSR
jgi:hypothetical protein